MIIEIPLLILVCLWLWNAICLSERKPKEFQSASSHYALLCHCINLIWLIYYYPHFNLRTDEYYFLFSILFVFIVLFFFRKISVELNMYFVLVTMTYIAIRYFIVINDKSQYLLYIATYEISIPLLWIGVFKLRNKVYR